jgi:hypothetical protein
MGVKGFVFALGFVLFCGGLAQADSIVPGHFTVDLNDVPGIDAGGWGVETLFTDTVDTLKSSKGFVANICNDSDAGEPNGDEPDCDNDPHMTVNNGGASSPFPTSFNSDENGGGLFDFQNDSGQPFTDILFTTTFVPGDSYTCASNIFSFCGFKIIPETNGPDQLQILFIGGTIAVASPEPAEYWFLLIACAIAVVFHRLRSRRVSA